MKNKKYIIRSQIREKGIFAYNLSAALGIWLFHYALGIPIWLLILLVLLLNYLSIAIFCPIFYFYEDKLERIFVFRPFFRKKIYQYNQIIKIKYLHIAEGYAPFAYFRIILNSGGHRFFKSFIFNRKKGKVKITEFLLSKNIILEVRTDSKKRDKEIIDLVKAKYPENVFINPDPHYWYKQKGYL